MYVVFSSALYNKTVLSGQSLPTPLQASSGLTYLANVSETMYPATKAATMRTITTTVLFNFIYSPVG